MPNWILKRLLAAIPIMIGISFIAFCLASLSPSDPAEVAIRIHMIVPTPEVIAETRAEMGLDDPFLVRYWNWVSAAARGDLGVSWITGRTVASELAAAFPPTLWLAATTLAIILGFSLTCGILAARHEGGMIDRVIRTALFTSTATPAFWAGLLLMWLFAVKLGWLPTAGMGSPSSVILPAVTLSLAYIGTYTRLIRANMIAAKNEGYAPYCRALGLKQNQVMRHMLRNSVQSSITALGMSIPKLVAGAFAVECIFAWPGLGRLAIASIFGRDFPVIQAYVLFIASLFLAFNLGSDILNAWLDPRQREENR